MCTLAVYREVSPDYPLVVAANRDEFLARPAAPPAPFPGHRSVVAGRDLAAGGTWLGARTDGSGRVAGLLNRRPAPDRPASGPGELSRGSLCLDALTAAAAGDVQSALAGQQATRYGGFNLFVADLEVAFVLDNGQSAVRRTPLATGLSVLTNLDVNDPRCPRLAGAWKRFAALEPLLAGGAGAGELVEALGSVLADHEGGTDGASPTPLSKVCVHYGDYGTRSSSIVLVQPSGAVRYFHADGPPCRERYREISIEAQ